MKACILPHHTSCWALLRYSGHASHAGALRVWKIVVSSKDLWLLSKLLYIHELWWNIVTQRCQGHQRAFQLRCLRGHSSDSLSHLRSHQPWAESHHGIINSFEPAFVETLPGNMLVTLGGGDHTLMQCLWWSSEDDGFFFILCFFCHFLSWISNNFHNSFVAISPDPSPCSGGVWNLLPFPCCVEVAQCHPRGICTLEIEVQILWRVFLGCECWKVVSLDYTDYTVGNLIYIIDTSRM